MTLAAVHSTFPSLKWATALQRFLQLPETTTWAATTSTRESSTGWLKNSRKLKALTLQMIKWQCSVLRKLLKRQRSSFLQHQAQLLTSPISQLTQQVLSTLSLHLHRLSSTSLLPTLYRLQWDLLSRLSLTAA